MINRASRKGSGLTRPHGSNQSVDRKTDVETKASDTFSRGPVVSDIRLSRLTHPRGTLVAMILLAVVFILFGMFAEARPTAHVPAPNTLDGAAYLVTDWVLHR